MEYKGYDISEVTPAFDSPPSPTCGWYVVDGEWPEIPAFLNRNDGSAVPAHRNVWGPFDSRIQAEAFVDLLEEDDS